MEAATKPQCFLVQDGTWEEAEFTRFFTNVEDALKFFSSKYGHWGQEERTKHQKFRGGIRYIDFREERDTDVGKWAHVCEIEFGG